MGGTGAKRKLKKLRRETEESSAVVAQCMHICGMNGIVISFPHEIPQVLQQLLESGNLAAVTTGGGGLPGQNGKATSLARLVAGPSRIPAAAPQEQTSVAPALASAPPMSFDELDFEVEFSMDSVASSQEQQAPGDGQMPPISIADMEARVEAANQRMTDRVATNGIQHKHGQGPPDLQGKKIGTTEGGENGAPARNADGGGRVNRVTGMSRAEQVRIIGKITGKDMDAPAASATIKPPR